MDGRFGSELRALLWRFLRLVDSEGRYCGLASDLTMPLRFVFATLAFMI